MKSKIKQHIPDERWFVEADRWQKDIQAIRESQFTLGNGLIGSRGILEEMPFDSHPGTYMAGVYDNMGSKVSDLVNLPNPIDLRLTIDGEKVDVSSMPNLRHKRYLNMRHGLLVRHTVFETATNNRIDYQSIRFFSMKDKNIAVMRAYLTALHKGCVATVSSDIDTSISNVSGIAEGRKRHFEIKDVSSKEKTISYVGTKTFTNNIYVSYAHSLGVNLGSRHWFSKEENVTFKLKKGQTLTLTKFISVIPKQETEYFDIKHKTIHMLQSAIELGYEKLLRRHCSAWEKLWKASDIKMICDRDIQRNVRFNIYHMLITGYDDKGLSSIGARTLSGEGYRGHIFWDSEIFILPFFMFTSPIIANSMLIYRARRLRQAKEIAKERGYKGAMFPWESAFSGYEETPPWARNLDGSIIKIHTHEMEFHITADIAYSVYRYYIATDDEDFMIHYGYELLFETARFWASAIIYDKKKKRFELRHVIGPDEFHEGVDNNAYTNMLARWNVLVAYGMYAKLKKRNPWLFSMLTRKLDLKEKEIRYWKEIVYKMRPNMTKNRIMEQYDGFFDKKPVRITELDENFMPNIPNSIRLKKIGDYRIVKQADVIMLLYLLSDSYDKKTKTANFNYYEPITVHKSSLSPAIHSVFASELGHSIKAFRYFHVSVNADISNLHGNTRDGIHAANLGGSWQALIHGFAGMRVVKETLSFEPKLPKEIRRMQFSVYWKGSPLAVTVENKRVTILCRRKKPEKKFIKLRIYGKIVNLLYGKKMSFKKGA